MCAFVLCSAHIHTRTHTHTHTHTDLDSSPVNDPGITLPPSSNSLCLTYNGWGSGIGLAWGLQSGCTYVPGNPATIFLGDVCAGLLVFPPSCLPQRPTSWFRTLRLVGNGGRLGILVPVLPAPYLTLHISFVWFRRGPVPNRNSSRDFGRHETCDDQNF